MIDNCVLAVLVAGAFISPAIASAQTAPGAEHQALQVLIGTWTTANPNTPQVSGTETTEWLLASLRSSTRATC